MVVLSLQPMKRPTNDYHAKRRPSRSHLDDPMRPQITLDRGVPCWNARRAMVRRRSTKSEAEPAELRSSTFRIGGERLLVISYAASAEEPDNLTRGEAAVARLAANGHTNAQIAKARGTALRTVANQMASILRKLRLTSRRELSARYHGRTVRDRSSK